MFRRSVIVIAGRVPTHCAPQRSFRATFLVRAETVGAVCFTVAHIPPFADLPLLASSASNMAKRILALFDVDGTLTVPRKV